MRGPGFWQGAMMPLKGLGVLVRHPVLLLWAVIPLVIAGVLDTSLVAFVMPKARAYVDQLVPEGAWYWIAADWVLQVVVSIAFVAAAALAFLVLYLAVAGPFNEILSERVERLERPGTPSDEIPGILGPLLDGLRQAGILLVLGAPALLISLVPVIGPPVFVLWTTLLLGFTFFEIPLARRGIPFREKRVLARRNLAPILGLGFFVLVATWIPGLQFVFMPAFVAGGTILYCTISEGKVDATSSDRD